jgi:N-acetylmuramoyl-L-alanine amidase
VLWRLRRIALATAMAVAASGAGQVAIAGSPPEPLPAVQPGDGPAHERFDAVVIDAGHGGDDHGAEGPEGLLEKQVVLEVARRLAERLQAHGLQVTMTRDRDQAVALHERTRIANDADADLFVSIHANGASSPAARGMETYFLSLDASDEASGRVAARENEAFGPSAGFPAAASDPLSAILGDLANNEHHVESNEFARLAQARLAAIDPSPSRGVKQAPFVVLMGVKMPAALLEIGFITNVREASGLASPERQVEIAGAIADAVLEFGQRFDARRGANAAATAPARDVQPDESGGGA